MRYGSKRGQKGFRIVFVVVNILGIDVEYQSFDVLVSIRVLLSFVLRNVLVDMAIESFSGLITFLLSVVRGPASFLVAYKAFLGLLKRVRQTVAG
jgi:hypothetical protein